MPGDRLMPLAGVVPITTRSKNLALHQGCRERDRLFVVQTARQLADVEGACACDEFERISCQVLEGEQREQEVYPRCVLHVVADKT